MSPAALIAQAAADGVHIRANLNGRLTVRGREAAVSHWLARIQDHKLQLLAHLASSRSESELREALSKITAGLALTPAEVRAALSPDDVTDWQAGLLPVEALTAFTRCLLAAQQRKQGEVPESYTVASTCRHCGPVWTWARPELPAVLASCIWCPNRRRGLPIPRPALVRCGDCRHFTRHPHHPHLGRCEQGELGAAAGHWDSDRRPCHVWLPEVTP